MPASRCNLSISSRSEPSIPNALTANADRQSSKARNMSLDILESVDAVGTEKNTGTVVLSILDA